MSFYVTTAIPYVNAAPHLGHALELVQADVLARHRRLRGEPVRFLTGTDENALKNVTAAAAAGVDVAGFVAANADRFAALRDVLDLSFDDFIRTSEDPRHARGVEELWRRSAERGDFYRRDYQGRYCQGCEQFYEPSEQCAEHDAPLEVITESNWFFRLSGYTERILKALTSEEVRIEPSAKRNEVLAFVRAGLQDISVSRPAARAGGWGIPVPGDPSQVIYVWWDALANYVTALGALDGSLHREWWQDSASRVHVIGKGIVRFHAVYWLALLLSAGLPLPTAVFVHEYLTIDGAKLSKSAGNAVDPADLAVATVPTRCAGGCCGRWRRWGTRTSPRSGCCSGTTRISPTVWATSSTARSPSCGGTGAARCPSPRSRTRRCPRRSTGRWRCSTCGRRPGRSGPRSRPATAWSRRRGRGTWRSARGG
ncbi:hypothetical protein GCM10027610_096930 [Dactylosporangium cerinum]